MEEYLHIQLKDDAYGATIKDILEKQLLLPKKAITRLKKFPDGILLNYAPCTVRSHVYPNDILSVRLFFLQMQEQIAPICIPLSIIYEDEALLVVDKPSNMAMYPKYRRKEPTLANAVSAYLREQGQSNIFRPVNRLDKDTCGLVLLAKSPWVFYQLQTNPIEKHYLAKVSGQITQAGRIDAPIFYDETQGRSFISEKGKPAITEYTPLKSTPAETLLSVRLLTGRTHQIRLHMSYIHHPLLGDHRYGGDCRVHSRQMLYAYSLSFLHPLSKRMLSLEAPNAFCAIQ